MRPVPILALLLPVSACMPFVPEGPAVDVPPGEVRVVAVQATVDRMTARLSDGTRCRAVRPDGVQGNWSGTTEECGYALPFTVTYQQGGSPSRFVIEDPAGVPVGPEGGPGPRAEVFLTDVDGQRRLFIAPLGPNVRFETLPSGTS